MNHADNLYEVRVDPVNDDVRQRRAPTESASSPEHPINARFHFLFLKELAASDLVDSHLHLLPHPLGVGEQPVDGLLHQIVSAPSRADGKPVEPGRLNLWQMNFHSGNLRKARRRVGNFL